MLTADTAYFDLSAGASGDMILGALVDAGLELGALRAALGGLALPGWSLEAKPVDRAGVAATLLDVQVHDEVSERFLADLLSVIAASRLPGDVQADGERILIRLAQAESRIHGQALERVHLHEVGGLDTIVDVVGAVVGMRLLGVRHVIVSPFPLARGQIQTAHGRVPLPAPAALALLQGAPVVGVEGDRETVTPTAAAILSTLAEGYGALPAMTLAAVGCGAGRREDPTPNVLRVMLGAGVSDGARTESVVELETNIDDMNPQVYDHLTSRLLAEGALDVTLTPMQMKKNRPGTCLRVYAPVARAAALRTLILDETTTLGVRERIAQRYVLAREIVTVETEYGALRAKIAQRPNGARTVTPEYDDCARAARAHGVPLQAVMDAVRRLDSASDPAAAPWSGGRRA